MLPLAFSSHSTSRTSGGSIGRIEKTHYLAMKHRMAESVTEVAFNSIDDHQVVINVDMADCLAINRLGHFYATADQNIVHVLPMGNSKNVPVRLPPVATVSAPSEACTAGRVRKRERIKV